jgi:hypothetical protein
MIDIAPLDLEGLSLPNATSAKEWFTPFTSQVEKGDWDWDGNWYDDDSE